MEQNFHVLELFPTLNGNGCTKNHMISLEKIIEIEKQIPEKIEEYKHLSEIVTTLY